MRSLLLLVILAAPALGGDAAPRYGHSEHGPAFDPGPRRHAVLDAGQGKVHFPVTANAPAQAFVDQAVAQFHGFQWYESERSFREALFRDPECVMALWGMAMAANGDVWFHEPQPRAQELTRQALALRYRLARQGKRLTAREDAYLDALVILMKTGGTALGRMAFLDALRAIVRAYPDDIEAKAFLAFELLKNDDLYKPARSTWLTRPTEAFLREADAVVDAVLARDPFHPAHHYKIHIWDYHEPERARRSTDPIGPSEPHIAHMWHMAGHIHWRLHEYAEAAWQQEASARTDHRYYALEHVMPFLNVNYLHNNDWLTESLATLGRAREALALSLNMIELPRHPKFVKFAVNSGVRGRDDLMDTLNLFEMWTEVERLAPTDALIPSSAREEEVKRLRLAGLAHYRLGHAERLSAAITALEAIKSPQPPSAGPTPAIPTRHVESPPLLYKPPAEEDADVARAVQEALLELGAYRDVLAGNPRAARRKLVTLEPLVQEPISWEDRRRGLLHHQLAQAFADAGDVAHAVDIARAAAPAYPGQLVPQAVFVELLARAGRAAEARREYRVLASRAAFADADLPVLARLRDRWHLGPLGAPARAYHWLRPELHPALESLGPLTWQPYAAPDLASLPEAAPARGKPALVVLNLGRGCAHCNAQLEALEVAAAGLRAAGVEPVVVRFDRARAGAFRAWRAYDEFEDQPLHGVYLVSANGRILWEDIGADPFTDFAFLTAEARRLLPIWGARR